MATTIPNTFAAGTVIDGPNVEANNDAVKLWTNGNMVGGDLKTSQKWITTPQVMTGFYNAIINQHEFTTGLVQGAPEMPKFNMGGMGVVMGNADNTLLNEVQLPTYDTANGNTPLPRTYVRFSLEKDAYVMYQVNFQMYPLDAQTGGYAASFKSSVFTVDIDGTLQNNTKHICQAQGDVGTSFANAPEADVIPPYEGVRYYCAHWAGQLTAGDHYIGIQGCSNEQITWVGRLGVSLEAYY